MGEEEGNGRILDGCGGGEIVGGGGQEG
jgi:hypothetical protein